MSWTKGQSRRENQPPFIHQEHAGESTSAPVSNNYFKGNSRRPDYSQRHAQHGQQPKEAAATFSHDGLQAFARVFAASVDVAIRGALPGLLDTATSKLLQTVKDEFKFELLEALRQLVSEEVSRAIDHRLVGLLKQPTVQSDMPDVDEGDLLSPETRRSRVVSEVALACRQLKEIGRPVRTSELPALLQGIRWSGNVSAKMTKLIHKSNGCIVRTGRGLYEYTGI